MARPVQPPSTSRQSWRTNHPSPGWSPSSEQPIWNAQLARQHHDRVADRGRAARGCGSEWRWSPRNTTTSPGSSVHCSPATASTISPRLAGEVLARARRVRHAGDAAAGRELHAVDHHAGDRVGQQLAHARRRPAGASRSAVLAGRAGPAARGAAVSSSIGTCSAVATWSSTASVGLRGARLEVAPGGARDAGELRHLLLGQPARLAQLRMFAARRAGQSLSPMADRIAFRQSIGNGCWCIGGGVPYAAEAEEDAMQIAGRAALVTGASRGLGRGARPRSWRGAARGWCSWRAGRRTLERGRGRGSAPRAARRTRSPPTWATRTRSTRSPARPRRWSGPIDIAGPQREHARPGAAARCSPTPSARTSSACWR